MMRVVDLIYALPDTLMVVLFSVVLDTTLMDALAGTALAKLGSNLLSLFIVFGALYWVGMARLVRARVLSLKKDEYVLAARALGAGPHAHTAQAHFARLRTGGAGGGGHAGALGHLYGELFELYRSGRAGAHAQPRFAGQRRARGPWAVSPTSWYSRRSRSA